MKEQYLPQIPQQNHVQTHSMHDPLKRTGHKWSTSSTSTRRIFTHFRSDRTEPPRQQDGIHLQQWKINQYVSKFEPPTNPQKMRLMALMREQIEIACTMMSNKFKEILKTQSRQIQTLQEQLIKNELDLKKKQKIIANMLANKIEQRGPMHQRIKYLEGELQKFKKRDRQIQMIHRRFEDKVASCANVENHIINVLHQKKMVLAQFLQTQKNRLDKCEAVVIQKLPQTNKFIASLKIEIKQLKNDIDSISNKEYQYQNYRLEQVIFQLKNLKNQVNYLQKHKNILKQTKLTRNQSEQDLGTPSKLNQHADESYYEGSGSYNSQANESYINDHSDLNYNRLIQVVYKSGLELPISVEIDQTGYIKSLDTGMYLVDQNGDGFQLDSEEIEMFTHQGIIKLAAQ